MIIYPAIDILESNAVRLTRGDYSQVTVYSEDPVAVALGFKEKGATALHVVDLEGARDGRAVNFEVIKRIAKETGMDLQVGGGIRTIGDIEKYLSIGVKQVILGTAAVETSGFLSEVVKKFGEAVAVSVDIKDGLVAIKGWTEVSQQDAHDFCSTVEGLGVKTLICTDISKDGVLGGTNIELYTTLRKDLSIKLIASGGITTLIEVEVLAALGVDGAILGTALYTDYIDLAEAIKVAKENA